MSQVRVFIADDHAIVRKGLSAYLAEVGGFEVVGEASDGRQVLNAELTGCDVLVLDLSLPIVSGTEVLRRVHARHPALPIVVHSMHPEEQFARRALAAGAAAYVSKERPPAELVAAIFAALRGEAAALSENVRAGGRGGEGGDLAPHGSLSDREHQVFLLLVSGRTVSEIAAELDLHSSTVSNHLARIKKKLGASTVADLVAYAFAEGLIERPPVTPSSG